MKKRHSAQRTKEHGQVKGPKSKNPPPMEGPRPTWPKIVHVLVQAHMRVEIQSLRHTLLHEELKVSETLVRKSISFQAGFCA